jgi:hypothetical protein
MVISIIRTLCTCELALAAGVTSMMAQPPFQASSSNRKAPTYHVPAINPCGGHQVSRAQPLGKVRSFVYLTATNAGNSVSLRAIAASPFDLIILGGGAINIPLDRGTADPTGHKLIFGYIDVSESAIFEEPDLFVNGSVPAWFGHLNPAYQGLYSVQYWNPAWEKEIFLQLDQLIADGYDGVFLDVLNGDSEWAPGNIFGNPVYDDRVHAMATLVSNVRAHLNSTRQTRPFYMAGNGPYEIAAQYPNSLANLDAVFNDWAYYGPLPTNGLTSEYMGTGTAQYVASTLAPIYDKANIVVFGNDYPLPLGDPTADLMSFQFYAGLDWIPSITTALADARILSTGPFMFMATPSNPSVTGTKNFTNYLSGGCAAAATLTGGDQGDYFIGGPGRNTIIGGSGNDTIYAHPAAAGPKNILDFQIAATNQNATTPSVSILVNGRSAIPKTPITAVYGTDVQEFQLDITSLKPITSVEIDVTGTTFHDQDNFSNVELVSIVFSGQQVNLTTGTFSNGASNPGYTYSNNGKVTFPASSFVGASYLSDTSDIIDGGAGTNTVIYRFASTNYAITNHTDGSVTVEGKTGSEGPDLLRNIQTIQFADKTITLK